jgi:hypothetical protein
MSGIHLGGIWSDVLHLFEPDPEPPAEPAVQTSGAANPTTLVTQPLRAPALSPPDPAALKTAQDYTDKTVAAAQASKLVADKLQKDYGNKAPEEDPVGWRTYVARREVANEDQAKAEQAIAAELRLTYQGDPNNKVATQNAARDITNRFKDDSRAQAAANAALQTVLTETPAQRNTNIKLNEVNQAADKLDDLIARQQGGDSSVTSQQITSARQEYVARQSELLKATETELIATYDGLPPGVMQHEDDPLAYAGRQMLARYANDPEFSTVIQAAVILHRVDGAGLVGPEAQWDMLGKSLPTGVDPSVKALVMSDPLIKKVVDTYVTGATKKIADTYAQGGTVAGAEMLRDVTDPSKQAAMSPEIAAAIINKSKPTIEKIVNDIHELHVKGKDGRQVGSNPQAGVQVANALSQAVDVAAAGSNWQKHEYNSPEIKTAVEGVARFIATHPAMNLSREGFQDAVGHGYATLALETVHQISILKMSDIHVVAGPPLDDTDQFEQMQRGMQEVTLDAIKDGLDDLKENNNQVLENATTGMAPLLVQGKYSPVLTEAEFRTGEQNLVNNHPDLKQAVIDGRAAIDAMGYRLVRTSEAVEFYRDELGGMEGYKQLDATRQSMMADDKVTSTILASGSAQRRMGAQVLLKLLGDDLKNGGGQAQSYGIGAQTMGDLTEFLAETYLIGKIGGGDTIDAAGLPLAATRAAHLPFFAGVGIWGGGGLLQAGLTAYLFDNVHLGGPGSDLRKGLLLGLVGGFAGFHLMQAGMAAARIKPNTFVLSSTKDSNQMLDWIDKQITKLGVNWAGAAESGQDSWGLYMKDGSLRDRWTKLAVGATPGLIKQLVGLMTIATVWDASGVFWNASGLQPYKNPDGTQATDTRLFKLATQGTNLGADSLLLRLQVREMALRYLGEKIVADPELKAAATARALSEARALAASEGRALAPGEGSLTLRLAGTYALDESAVSGGATGAGKWLGSSKFLNVFEGIFGNAAFAAEAAAWVEGISPALKGLLFRTVVGESGEATAARFALLGDNPIGWIVNIAYLATTVGNFLWDHNKNVEIFQKYDRTFMEGAGLDHDHAEVMAQHHWWSSNAKVDGFLKAYDALGGDPQQFIKYINGTDTKVLDAMLGAAENMDDQLDDKGIVPATQDDTAFLSLPLDPAKVDVSKYTTISYNAATKRYEDPVTQTYWAGGVWFYDPSIGNSMGRIPARTDGFVHYDPEQMGLMYNTGFMRQVEITSASGWRNWMMANNMPLPPQAPVS